MYPFLALLILVVIPFISDGQHETTCDVVPKDQYIEVGSNTEIVCQTSCVPGKVFWTLNKIPVDESLSHITNSTHNVLTLRNFTLDKAMLECSSVDTKQVLGGTAIKTYSKPSKISCILKYIYKPNMVSGVPELLTCNWEHQMDSSMDVNYTVLIDQTKICNSNITTCTAKHSVQLWRNFSVTVRARTTAWEASSNTYTFNPYYILKMSRPGMEVTTFYDHLSVKCNRSLPSKKCHCQVQYYKAINESTPEWVLNKTLNSNQREFNVTIENLESCSKYKFAARCALEKAPWSEWTYQTILTKPNKRDVKLRLWRKVAEPEKNGIRKVHAMWSEIPSACQGTFSYTIQQTPYLEHTAGVNYTDIICGNSTCDVDVNQDAHRINLTVFHNEHLLAEESVYVPAFGESLPQVADIQTSTLDGVILVRWKAPDQPASGYMIDYTHDGNQYYWKESKYTSATLFDLLHMKPYNITITPLFGDKTGHGTQALQICSRVGDPGNVTISDVQPSYKSAYVRWIVKSQEACSGAVVNYTVFYCTEKGPLLNVTVDGTKQDIFLKELIPVTQYSVCVKATALTGATKSIKRFFKTKTFDPKLITALIVCGCITMFLVLSLGLWCAIKWKKLKEKPVPNPGLSSVALWPSASNRKGACSFQPFSNPSESLCDRVYTEEAQRTSTSSLATDCNGNTASEQTEEFVGAPDPVKPVETRHLPSPGESMALLFSENGPTSPYRSQSSVETHVSRTSKHSKRVPGKQQEKTPPLTVYVTLDMFEQGQGR